MGIYAERTDNIIEELLKIVPSVFLLSKKFENKCKESDFYGRWNFWHTKITLNNMFVSPKEKASLILENVCHELSKNSNRTLYKFISLVVKSYCEQENTKVDLRGLRVLLRSSGIIKLTEIEQFDSNTPFSNNLIITVNKWDEIKDAVSKLEMDCIKAEEENDFSNVGNTCRHLLIQLAQLVYDPKLHGAYTVEGTEIGKAHVVEMLSNYFSYNLSGKSNKEYRAYTIAAMNLANMLTHKFHATKKDMQLTASATINLVYIVGTIGDKFNNESFI